MNPLEQNLVRHSHNQISTRSKGAVGSLLLLLMGIGTEPLLAATYNWIATPSDYYTNAGAWDLSAVPGIADTANIGNGGTVLYDSTMTNALTSMLLGDAASGTFTMAGGVLSITNTGTTAFHLGEASGSSASFTMNDGVLTVARPSTQNRYFQDSFYFGFGIGSVGTFTINGGNLNVLSGAEFGIHGDGIFNVNGGTVLLNGWFTLARGASSSQTDGSGTFNLTGGTVYSLKGGANPAGLRLLQNAPTAVANISGGAYYGPGITFAAASTGSTTPTATLNISGGQIYIGDMGIKGALAAGQVNTINVSGGTFHTVDLLPNANGTQGLASVLSDGTNWTWETSVAATVNLTNSPGPGAVTFAPEAGRTITLSAPFVGPGRLIAAGPGTVVLGGAEQYTGGTTVTGGTLAIGAAQNNALGLSLSAGTTLALNNNGSLVESPLNVPSGTTLDFNAGNVTHLFTNDVTGPGDVLVTLGGNGFEQVSGNLGHSGYTVVSTGTLVINGTLNNSSAVLVTNTGTLAGSGLVGAPVIVASTNDTTAAHLRIGESPLIFPGTLTVSNLTLGAGSELDIKLGTATTVGSGVNDLLVIQGNLNIDPNAVLNIVPLQPLTAGTYVVATYTGTRTGSFNPSVGGLTRYGMTIDYGTPGQIKLVVTGSNASLVWQGDPTNTWDVLTTANWLNGLNTSTFAEGDAVTFDSSASNFNVIVAGTVYPASITINGDTNYSITASSGRISGGTGITKNGNGTTLLLSGTGLGNDYTGSVQINGGILKLNGGNALGATNSGTTVANGASLDLNGNLPAFEPITIQGAGLGGTNGALLNTAGTSGLAGLRNITLANDTLINSAGRIDFANNGVPGGSFQGNGHNVTKIGASQLFFRDVGETGLGDINVLEGQVGFQTTITMGDPSKTCTIAGSTASLRFFTLSNALTKNLVLTNGATLESTSGSNVFAGPITLWQTNNINVSGNVQMVLGGALSGSGGFTKGGAGQLYVNGANTYSGSTFLNAGSLVLGPGSSLANSALINLADNTLLDASLPAAGLALGNGQMLAGSGSVVGNVSAAAGAMIAPGTTIAAGTLSVSNSLALSNGSTNVIKLSSDPYSIGLGVNDFLTIGSNLVLNGTSTIKVVPLGTLDGSVPYTIMQYNTGPFGNGGLVLAPGAHFTAFSSNPRYTVSVDTNLYGYIQLNLSGSASPLLWKGDVAGKQTLWDHSTTNWLNTGTSQRDNFFNGDEATFDDSASSSLVTIVGTESAGKVTMANNTKNYTFDGGLLSGPLDMEGTASLTLSMSNAPALSSITANAGTLVFNIQGVDIYSNNAPVTDNGGWLGTIVKAATNTLVLNADSQNSTATLIVRDGVLRYTSGNNLGYAAAPLCATNTGTLDMNGVNLGIKNVIISGNGFQGQGALTSSKGASGNNAPINILTLASDAVIGAPGNIRWDQSHNSGNSPQIHGNNFKLTKVGTGTIIVYDQYDGDTHLGDIEIAEGRLGFQLFNAGGTALLGDSSKSLTVQQHATLTFYDVTNGIMDKHLMLNGAGDPTNGLACFDSGGVAATTNSFSGPINLAGTNNLFGLRVGLALSNAISGSGGFIAGRSPVGAGTGTLYLYGNNTYTGPTIISNNYTVVVGASSSLGASSLIQINPGARLDVSAPGSLTLGAGQTLTGAGTNIGNVVVGNGATLAAGLPVAATYNLTVDGSLTFQPGSTNIVLVNKTTAVANNSVVGLNSVTMGGTLMVTNIGAALDGGDAIPLFTASSYTGTFAAITPPVPGPGLVWDTSTLGSDGMVRVIRTGPSTDPTNIVAFVSGGNLALSWPSNHIGWTLQGQTNTVNVGLSANWADVAGSTTTNMVIIPIDPLNGAAFYRLILK